MDYSESVIWYIVFLFSTTVHEASHALSAYKMGDSTAYKAGQVSLNPIPHIKREPIGTVVVPILSYFIGGWMIGWASTPYNYDWAYSHPKKAAAMSVAGPISNFLLILVLLSAPKRTYSGSRCLWLLTTHNSHWVISSGCPSDMELTRWSGGSDRTSGRCNPCPEIVCWASKP